MRPYDRSTHIIDVSLVSIATVLLQETDGEGMEYAYVDIGAPSHELTNTYEVVDEAKSCEVPIAPATQANSYEQVCAA
jgi:hypothetical protein